MKCFIGKTDIPDWLLMVSPYNKDFVEQFKATIPSAQRKWDPESKRWLIGEIYAVEIAELIKQHFPEAEITTDLVQETTPEVNLFEQLFTVLPAEFVDKIYKTLSMAVHPDKGGSNELMSKLNQAYENRRKKYDKANYNR
mgnify:CR=1 FL=1